MLEAIGLEPSAGAEKYIALAQLCEGQQALELFQRAVEVLTAEASPEDNARTLSSLYCSMAELYMTDLCMEANAEERCGGLLEEARTACPESYEVLQTKANMKMSQNKPDEACEALLQAISMWQAIPFGMCPNNSSRVCTNYPQMMKSILRLSLGSSALAS